ncbi:unnamed protein product [Rhizophagus irregularis]|nr:unnamed protein product [Rhizophagus irregularis]
MHNTIDKFWKSFDESIHMNKNVRIYNRIHISNDLISAAKKYAHTNGPGCVDNKKALWINLKLTYPDGIKRASFMARLANGRYVYRKDLGGLCNICNEYGYEVFDTLINIIRLNINEKETKNRLIHDVEKLRLHLRRGFENELSVNENGMHVDTINHCLLYAFGECNNQHKSRCANCDHLFILMQELITILPENFHETIQESRI